MLSPYPVSGHPRGSRQGADIDTLIATHSGHSHPHCMGGLLLLLSSDLQVLVGEGAAPIYTLCVIGCCVICNKDSLEKGWL